MAHISPEPSAADVLQPLSDHTDHPLEEAEARERSLPRGSKYPKRAV